MVPAKAGGLDFTLQEKTFLMPLTGCKKKHFKRFLLNGGSL
jgi:hypothetical protein